VVHLKKKKFKNLVISCDGGAASGKTTGARLISKKYNLKFLSSGLLYRYAAYLLLKTKTKNKILFLRKRFKNLNYKNLNRISLHSPRISEYSAVIAKNKDIRKILKGYQIKFSKKFKNCCIEGRDISTKILPNSDLKFFFICNINTAALRRFKELKKKSKNIKLKDVKRALQVRNKLDKQRKISPLLKHRNSIIVNSQKLNKKEMIEKMSKHIEKVINN
jgi:cytidylate kinase